MPRLNVLGTFEELENTNAYSKFELRPKKRFHYLHITAEVINDMKTCFSSISILIKNYRVHRLLAISTLITTLTKFYGFRIIWVIKRHPMKNPSSITEEWKKYKEEHRDAYESKEPSTEPSKEEKSDGTTIREVRINLNQQLMDINKDSIYGPEDDLSSIGLIDERLEDVKSNSSHYAEDIDNIWSPTQPISNAMEPDEMDELSPRDYKLNPIQTKDNSEERHGPLSVPPEHPEDHSSLTLETSSSLSVESSTSRYNGTESSVSENKNTPNIDLYLVLDGPYQLSVEILNKIMEQPFKQINYSVDTFDRIYYINEVGTDEIDYGLVSFIE